MRYNIYVPKAVYMDENLTDYDVMMYCVIQPFYSLPLSGGAIVSLDMLKYAIYGEKEWNWKQRKEFKDSFSKLLDLGIYHATQISDNLYDFERYEAPVHYAVFDYSAIHNILRSGYKSKYGMLRYLCALTGSFNNKIEVGGKSGVIGTQKISLYQNMLNISEDTVIRYNDALKKLKIIYIAHISGNGDHEFHSCNIYGRYEDKELVDQYAYTRSFPQDNANGNRAVSQKYNAFVKAGGNGYSYEERLRLYQQCKSYNAEMDRLHEERLGGLYLKRKKDLSVFNLEDDEIFE